MRRLFVLAILVLVHAGVVRARTWTDVQGRTLAAEYIGREGEDVTVLKHDDRRQVTLKFSLLSGADQAFVIAQGKAEPVAGDEVVSTPDESYFLPFKERLKRFKFAGQTCPADYLGVASFVDRPLGKAPVAVDGLSLGKDGSIVLSAGGGTVPGMKLARWSPINGTEDIVPLLYKKFSRETTRAERAIDEREGRFWFFGGQVAHDRDGAILFTLGACCDNGIFRVKREQPVNLQRLNTCIASSSLQVPPWDQGHAYIARGNTITRFKLSAGAAEVKDVVFSVDGDEIYLGNTLLLGQGKIIAGVSFPTGEKDSRGVSVSGRFGILIDVQERGYRLVSDGFLGPMALAPDSSRRIRAARLGEERRQQICEFEIRR